MWIGLQQRDIMLVPLLDPAQGLCIMGGTVTHDTVSANVKIEGSPVNLEGGKFSIAGCTKSPSTVGALPNCVGSIPSVTFVIFTKIEGVKPICDFSIQFLIYMIFALIFVQVDKIQAKYQ